MPRDRTDSTPPGAIRRAVGEVLNHANDGVWSQLSGGRSNRVWSVAPKDGGTPVAVKLFGQSTANPLFANDADAEARALTALSGTGLAPKLIAGPVVVEGHGPLLIYELARGAPWSRQPDEVAGLLRRLHDRAAPDGFPASPDGSGEIAAQVHGILSACSTHPQAAALADLRPRGPAVAASGRCVFLHGDPVPGNIIVTEAGPILIDWQCPMQGDPVADIALFLSPAMQITYRGQAMTRAEADQFLSAYDDAGTVARYRALSPWYHWRMAAYCLWRAVAYSEDTRTAYAAECAALAARS